MVLSNAINKTQIAFYLVVLYSTSVSGAFLPMQDHSDDSYISQWDGSCGTDAEGRVCGHDIGLYCEKGTNYCVSCMDTFCGVNLDDFSCRKICPAWFSKHKVRPTLPVIAQPILNNSSSTPDTNYTSSTENQSTLPDIGQPISAYRTSTPYRDTALTKTSFESNLEIQSRKSNAWYLAYAFLGLVIIMLMYLIRSKCTRFNESQTGSWFRFNYTKGEMPQSDITITDRVCVYRPCPIAQAVDQPVTNHIHQATETSDESLPDQITLAKAVTSLDPNIFDHTSSPTENSDSSTKGPPTLPIGTDISPLAVDANLSALHNDEGDADKHLTTHASARACKVYQSDYDALPHPVPEEGKHE